MKGRAKLMKGRAKLNGRMPGRELASALRNRTDYDVRADEDMMTEIVVVAVCECVGYRWVP